VTSGQKNKKNHDKVAADSL